MYGQVRAMNMRRVSATRLLGIFLCLVAAAAHSQSPADSAYTEVFYRSGSLRIQAYLYKPYGDGPFPDVIYNHGSRAGRERRAVPFEYIGRLLTRAGYVVLVPERRGYGGSDGPTWSEEVGNDRGQRFIARLQGETDDVLAAREYLRTLPFADPKRIGIMGWSLGGIVTMFAVSRSTTFAVAIGKSQKIIYQFSHSAVESGRRTWEAIDDVRDAPQSFGKPSWQRERRFHTFCRVTQPWDEQLSRSWCEPSARPCRLYRVRCHSSALPRCPSSVRWGCTCYGTVDSRPTRFPNDCGQQIPPSFS